MTIDSDQLQEKYTFLSERLYETVEIFLLVLNQMEWSLLDIVCCAPDGSLVDQRCVLDALYQALIRIILRLVVIFLAEARDLFPRTHPFYYKQYSLTFLLEQLRNPIQPVAKDAPGAWSRLLQLFALIHTGFVDDQLAIPAYEGALFQPGFQDSSDTIARALSLFESLDKVSISDTLVLDLLEAVQKIFSSSSAKKQRCQTGTSINLTEICPEYIGLIYEGLLTFHLQCTTQSMGSWRIGHVTKMRGAVHFSLISHSSTRKGSGSFYTSSQLARALAQKTLMPVVFTIDDPIVPRLPEEILALKICDPACGTASFLLAALRYLTDVMYHSMCYHRRLDPSLQEQIVKKRLRCQIAQQCLYGVDCSLLAIELAHINLWIELSDCHLPFTYLDQHIKVGNALIGAWSCTYQHYPLLAWMREGGDQDHVAGVHYAAKVQTCALHTMHDEIIKPQLLDQMAGGLQRERCSAADKNGEVDSQELKCVFDEWCAIWFWPLDQLAHVPTPASYGQRRPATSSTRRIVAALATEIGFFHWELEFPDVFQRSVPGFDAILANPPWETSKLSSHEFFSRYDPLYSTYGKQEALSEQRRMFQHDCNIEYAWIHYQACFKCMSNWVKYSGAGDQDVPFRYQGSVDLNTYKLFLELSHYLLRSHGFLGMICPASIYTDQGAAALRRLFLDHCNWSLLFGFCNRQRIFDIHTSFKFVVLLVEKDGLTGQLHVAFNQEHIQTLERRERDLLSVSRQQIERFSPASLTIIEVQEPCDLIILEKIYAHGILLSSQTPQGWLIRYKREFDMTNDASLFAPVQQWQLRSYCPDYYGRWVHPDGTQALPVYEGRMVGAFDPAAKGWVSGKGRRALWRDISWAEKVFEPQYLMSQTIYQARETSCQGNKVGFMDISSSTNLRSMYATFISGLPCGNVVPIMQPANGNIISVLALIANLNSFVYDYVIRCHLGGLHLNYFVIAETPLLVPSILCSTTCAQLAARLNLIMPCFAPQWLELRSLYPALGYQHWLQLWAVTEHERLRLRCILDALIADLYGLKYEDLCWILRDDPHNSKGFWRVDKHKPSALRQTSLTLLAFARLKVVGRQTFESEDWQFPAEIASQLGPRLLLWQTTGTVGASWELCQAHTQRLNTSV